MDGFHICSCRHAFEHGFHFDRRFQPAVNEHDLGHLPGEENSDSPSIPDGISRRLPGTDNKGNLTLETVPHVILHDDSDREPLNLKKSIGKLVMSVDPVPYIDSH